MSRDSRRSANGFRATAPDLTRCGRRRDEQLVGGKAAKLAQLARAEFELPRGFCLGDAKCIKGLQDIFIVAANADSFRVTGPIVMGGSIPRRLAGNESSKRTGSLLGSARGSIRDYTN